MRSVDEATAALLESLLDVAARRQSLLSANIANVDTPGYQTRDLDFERAMAAADRASALPQARIGRTDPAHLPGPGSPPLDGFESVLRDLPRRNDQNNVSVDREMLALARTAGRYTTTIELLRKRFALLRYAIQDGRGGGA